MSSSLILPWFIVVRGADYDEDSDALELSARTPFPATTISGLQCFPFFTLRQLAQEFIAEASIGGKVVECDRARALRVVETLNPAGITFDPNVKTRKASSYTTKSVIEWLHKNQ